MPYRIVFPLIILLLAGCKPDSKPFALPLNAMDLIASDSAKTWKLARRTNDDTRMNMGDCFLSYRITYYANKTLKDNNGEQADCGPSLTASWDITYAKNTGNPHLTWRSEELPDIMHTDGNRKDFKILAIDSTKMVLEYRHRQFSDKNTVITDIYVPEDADINDRDFHW